MDYLVQSRFTKKKTEYNKTNRVFLIKDKILFGVSILLLIASVCAPFILKNKNPYVAAASYPLLFVAFIIVLVYNLRSIDKRTHNDDITRKLCFEGLLKKAIIEVTGSCSDDTIDLLIIKFQRRIDNLQKKQDEHKEYFFKYGTITGAVFSFVVLYYDRFTNNEEIWQLILACIIAYSVAAMVINALLYTVNEICKIKNGLEDMVNKLEDLKICKRFM